MELVHGLKESIIKNRNRGILIWELISFFTFHFESLNMNFVINTKGSPGDVLVFLNKEVELFMIFINQKKQKNLDVTITT